jgi:hypothetical protein
VSSATPSVLELQRRLVFSLLRPVARLSRLFRLPLGTLEDLCRLAYFEELRRGGATPQAEVARIFGRSLRTVGQLEREYRDDFLAPEHEVERTRRLEDALESGPLTAAEAATRLGESADELRGVLEGLAAAGRVHRLPDDRFALNHAFASLVRQDLTGRIDGLNHQLDVVTAAILTRFFNPSAPMIARTLSFVADPATVEALAQRLAREMRATCGDAEEAALESGRAHRYGATLALAPMDALDEVQPSPKAPESQKP